MNPDKHRDCLKPGQRQPNHTKPVVTYSEARYPLPEKQRQAAEYKISLEQCEFPKPSSRRFTANIAMPAFLMSWQHREHKAQAPPTHTSAL